MLRRLTVGDLDAELAAYKHAAETADPITAETFAAGGIRQVAAATVADAGPTITNCEGTFAQAPAQIRFPGNATRSEE